MLLLGCHLSAAKGYAYMGREAVSIGANTFQFFTRNPRGGSAKALDPEDVTRFRDFAAQAGIPVILAHAPYTLNGCSGDENVRRFARETMRMISAVWRPRPVTCTISTPAAMWARGWRRASR